MKKFYSLLSLLLISFVGISAQNVTKVTGKLLDENGEALPFATVLLNSAQDSSLAKAGYSSEDGSFILAPVKAGNYFVKVSFSGLSPYSSEVFEVKSGQDKVLEPITLAEVETNIDEVQIRAQKPLVQVKPDMTVFNVESSPNTIGTDALELLRKAPGVVVDNNDNIVLLGKSGVRIYVDGKPSPLSAQDLAAMLKTMNSSQIESIEIITNPSSKFDAEGNAGIINIKLKKDQNIGTNGNVTLGFAQGIFPKYNGSVSLNYRNKKFNAFGTYSAAKGLARNFMSFYREQNGLSFDQHSAIVSDYFNHNFKAGADFFINDKHTVGFIANGFFADNGMFTNSNTVIASDSLGQDLSILKALSENDQSRKNVNFNLNYGFDNKKGTKLNVDVDYGIFDLNRNSFQPNVYYTPDEETVLDENIFATESPTAIQITTGKIDYERPLGKGKLGMGVKSSYVSTDNTFDFYNYNDGDRVLDSLLSNNFVYTENVNAAYANYQTQIKKFGIQAGLRLEHTYSLGDLTSLQNTGLDRVERNYVNLFPSGGITYQLNQNNSFRVTYSRRIDRPRYQDLNPFQFRLDELTYQQGNPFLQPQYTHAFQLGHTFKYTLNSTLSYSRTTDLFTQITDTLGESRSFITTENLSSQDNVSLNVSYPFQIFKWWSTYTNGTVYWQRNLSDQFGEGKEIDLARTSFNIFHQSNFSLPAGFSVQVSGFYNSPSIWGANFRNSEFWGIEAGLTKKMLKGRGTFRASVSDIFHSMQWRGVQEFGGLYMDARGGWESRQLKLNFTYSFGNQKVKQARKRKTGLEDEKDRASGGSGGR